MSNLFVEIYPYHYETLYPYFYRYCDEGSVLLHNPDARGNQLFEAIDCPKRNFSIRNLVREIRANNVRSVHVNSVGMKLNIQSLRHVRYLIQMILLPLACKILSCKVSGIVHEADQFYDTGLFMDRRNRIFMKLFGRFYIRAYDQIFVLSAEVKEFLRAKEIEVELLDTTPLERFVATDEAQPQGRFPITLSWIGSVDELRRNWRLLLDIEKEVLASTGIGIDLICDISQGQGVELLKALESKGIQDHFVVRHYRPDDHELFSATYSSDVVLCFYSTGLYEQIKTSGARHIASAFGKPILCWDSGYKIITATGEVDYRSQDINDCLLRLRDTILPV